MHQGGLCELFITYADWLFPEPTPDAPAPVVAAAPVSSAPVLSPAPSEGADPARRPRPTVPSSSIVAFECLSLLVPRVVLLPFLYSFSFFHASSPASAQRAMMLVQSHHQHLQSHRWSRPDREWSNASTTTNMVQIFPFRTSAGTLEISLLICKEKYYKNLQKYFGERRL
jgi:hypothetical protein